MSHVLVGKVDNGTIAEVAFGFYTGRAAIRRREGGGEASFPGDPPMAVFPQPGTVDEMAVTVTAVRRSETSGGMLVATFRLTT